MFLVLVCKINETLMHIIVLKERRCCEMANRNPWDDRPNMEELIIMILAASK